MVAAVQLLDEMDEQMWTLLQRNLAGITEDEADWRPHPDANNVRWLVGHLAWFEEWAHDALCLDGRYLVDRNPMAYLAGTMPEVIARFAAARTRYRERLAELTDSDLDLPRSYFARYDVTGLELLKTHALHLAGHRFQVRYVRGPTAARTALERPISIRGSRNASKYRLAHQLTTMATQADARRIALSLPGVEEAVNDVAFTVLNKGKLKGFAWVWKERVHPKKPRIPNHAVLAIRTANLGQRDALLVADGKKFFTEPHYAGFPAILVRLDAVTVADLEILLEEGWRCLSPANAEPSVKPKSAKSAKPVKTAKPARRAATPKRSANSTRRSK